MRSINISEKLLNTIGIIGLVCICSAIFYFNTVVFVVGSIAIAFFVVASSLSVGFETMDYDGIMRSVTEIIETDKEKLVHSQDTIKLSRIIEELDRIKKPELLSAVVNKYAANLEDKSPKVRAETARMFKKIIPTMQKAEHGKTYIDLNATFIDVEDLVC